MLNCVKTKNFYSLKDTSVQDIHNIDNKDSYKESYKSVTKNQKTIEECTSYLSKRFKKKKKKRIPVANEHINALKLIGHWDMNHKNGKSEKDRKYQVLLKIWNTQNSHTYWWECNLTHHLSYLQISTIIE